MFFVEENDSIKVQDTLTWAETAIVFKQMAFMKSYWILLIFYLLQDCRYKNII